MQAKNGELAIARFDSEEKVCFVTGRDKSQTKFVYWDYFPNGTIMYDDILPKGRVISAAPKPGSELLLLGGEFCKLTIDDVVPATEKNMAALCLSVDIDTSQVKLGGCYHTGKAYCLGYRNGHDGEVELDTKIFTGLNGGVESGAESALNRHREKFDCTADIPRFIVELAAVRIIDENTNVDTHVGPDICDQCLNSVEHCVCCENFKIHVDFCSCDETSDDDEDCKCGSHSDDCNCDGALDDVDDYCFDCGERDEDCLCYEDDDDCIRCGMDSDTCGCWDEGGCMDTSDLDDENVDKTFRPMNAFARARWLKACSR